MRDATAVSSKKGHQNNYFPLGKHLLLFLSISYECDGLIYLLPLKKFSTLCRCLLADNSAPEFRHLRFVRVLAAFAMVIALPWIQLKDSPLSCTVLCL